MKKLLLHCCCGPCSTAVIEKLKGDYDITLFYYNPNIEPYEELEKRAQELKKVAIYYNVPLIIDNSVIDFSNIAKGMENQKEGGTRCELCFNIRLSKTAEYAKNKGFDIFCTTLTVSPHKNAELINKVGKNISDKVGIEFLQENFKKQNGYLKSIELSKKLNLYRQNYCGCKFSKN